MMTTTEMLGRVRELIEEELGEFRQFAGAPATELEQMADRLTRAIAPVVARDALETRRDAA